MRGPDHSVSPPADEPVPPDAALLERYVKGADQQAFAELVRRHSGWVFSIAQRRSGKVELAQECAQNVFAAMARKAPRLGALPSLPAWLHRATMLESAALLRRDFRYEKAMKQHGDEIARQAEAGVPDVWQALRDEVDEALNSLSGADRDLLIQHHVEGRTFPEIAKDLGATEAAAQRRGHRALEKLAARLRRYGIALPAAAVGVALTSGMKAEAAQAEPMVAGILKVIGESGVGAGTSAAGGGAVFPAWVVSPAMLAAIVIVSAGVPVFWSTAGTQAEVPLLEAGNRAAPDKASGVAGVTNPSSSAALVPKDQSLQFLRQALEQLGKQPSTGEPTKLGLQLRKYMLNLTVEELESVGKLLGEVPGYKGEVPAIVGAFSTRLAQLNPPLALTLLADSADKGEGKNGGIRFSRTAFLDVLTRGAELPAVVAICANDKDLRMKLLQAWASHDPRAAMVFAEERLAAAPEEFDRGAYLMPWMSNNLVDAIHWLDENAEKHPAVFERVNSMHPGGVADWAVQQLPLKEVVEMTLVMKDPLVRNAFVNRVFSYFGKTQPEVVAGLAPLMQLQEGAKPLSVSGFLNAWRKTDEPAAVRWVEGLSEGGLKTAAQTSLAKPLPPSP